MRVRVKDTQLRCSVQTKTNSQKRIFMSGRCQSLSPITSNRLVSRLGLGSGSGLGWIRLRVRVAVRVRVTVRVRVGVGGEDED